MLDHVVLHYGEIGTKGANRGLFEQRLARNVRKLLAPAAAVTVRREPGRLAFSLAPVPEGRREELLRLVALQPGVAWLAAATRTEPTVAALAEAAVAVARRGQGTFRITARRTDKTLPFDSREIATTVGAAVLQATGRGVHLRAPDLEIAIEVDRKAGYVYGARLEGPDGLPTGSAGRVVALLSGGIDSPVAAWRMMVRGCHVLAVHLWNRSYSGEGVREKVLDLGRALARHQGVLRLVLVPFDDLQREVVAAAPAAVRMLLYRRAMLRVASEVRRASKSEAIVVGDAVSQVASQTLPNLASVYPAADAPILAPLQGAVKKDTIEIAKRIGTYDISIRPGADCCGLLVAKHPRTSSTAALLDGIESTYDVAGLVRAACEAREVHDFHALG
jgi:thiamine biosynthesis protein ThiI